MSEGRGRSSRCRRWVFVATLGLALLAGLPVLLRLISDSRARQRTYSLEDVPPRSVAIIFGAGYWPGYGLSAVLEDRVATGVALYQQGSVKKLLMTGDNRTLDYNEPGAMRARAIELGVPAEDIVLDYAGRRTYDSCYRAGAIFRVEDAILVTQAYHLDRALLTANGLGLEAISVAADRRDYRYIRHYWLRELAATTVAYWQVYVTRPEPVLGDPLPIWP